MQNATHQINKLPKDRLSVVLSRIASRILLVVRNENGQHSRAATDREYLFLRQDQDAFTTEEKSNLAAALGLDSKATGLILDTLAFIFETVRCRRLAAVFSAYLICVLKAAYHQSSLKSLKKNLIAIDLNEATVSRQSNP